MRRLGTSQIAGSTRNAQLRRVREQAINADRKRQKLNEKSLMPFHLPVSGSSTTLSSALPYWAGAFGFNIWNGLPPGWKARGRTPSAFWRWIGGGFGAGPGLRPRALVVKVEVVFFRGDCAMATVLLAKIIRTPRISNFFIFPLLRRAQVLAG
jgi:hypothetical protein